MNIKWKLKQEGLVLLELLRRESKAIICLQRVYRGHRARYHVHKMLITKAVYHKAAILIQKVYRSSKVMHWKDIRLNVIASFVLNRHAIDRHDAIVTSRLRYKQFIYDIKGDSSSDEDKEEGEIEWIKSYDMERKRDFWFNNVDNNILFQEPKVKLGHEKSLIGRRVRIYWIVQVSIVSLFNEDDEHVSISFILRNNGTKGISQGLELQVIDIECNMMTMIANGLI